MVEEFSKDNNSDREAHSSSLEPKVISSWLYETVLAFSGNNVTRLRSSLFYCGALLSFAAGIALLYHDYFGGGFLVLTLAPLLLFYPLIRFLFGGKDSFGAVLATVVVEEILKGKISKAMERSSRKKKC